MESRTCHSFPQVPLRHIVTSLDRFIILHTHPQTFWMSGNSPAAVNYWSTKMWGGGWQCTTARRIWRRTWNGSCALSPRFMVPVFYSSHVHSTQISVAELCIFEFIIKRGTKPTLGKNNRCQNQLSKLATSQKGAFGVQLPTWDVCVHLFAQRTR